MPNKPEDARLVAFVAAKNAAEAARIIGAPGKTFRDKLRRAGHYATKGTGWESLDAETRATFYPTPSA
jgi:hypothetical protein